MHLPAEGVEAVAEAFGGVLLATAIDEDGAEGLVEALGVVGGLEEEEATRGVVPADVPGCEALLSRNPLWGQRGAPSRGHAATPGKAPAAGKHAPSQAAP